ncbi:MAG TPA: geranylgeranylglycerol-phosphate geranylgeranyltransferase [Candidatus Acidoferrales bacterium]|nr:geranylgeranylglycerol-phosphate geranylgeranyltransferase [Candidatus Acidoferrales bacterium]
MTTVTTLKGYLAALRPLNCLMGSIAAVIGGFVSAPLLSSSLIYPLSLASIAVFLIIGGGNSINDYFDVEIDKINRPNRPVPTGAVTQLHILTYSAMLLSVGIVLSGAINFACLSIAMINSALLILYSWKFKRLALIGNVLIGYLTGSTFLFGGAALSAYFVPSILFLSAMFAITSREIIKDVEDIKGDLQFGASTLPIKYGVWPSLVLAACLMFVAVVISPIPFLISAFGWAYLSIVVVADIILMYSIALSWKSPTKASTYIKYGMFAVLMAYILGRI